MVQIVNNYDQLLLIINYNFMVNYFTGSYFLLLFISMCTKYNYLLHMPLLVNMHVTCHHLAMHLIFLYTKIFLASTWNSN